MRNTEQSVNARRSLTSPPDIVLRQVAVQSPVTASLLRKIVRYIRRLRLTNVGLAAIEERQKRAGIVMITPDGPGTQVLLVQMRAEFGQPALNVIQRIGSY